MMDDIPVDDGLVDGALVDDALIDHALIDNQDRWMERGWIRYPRKRASTRHRACRLCAGIMPP
jgi:hypothetical protein